MKSEKRKGIKAGIKFDIKYTNVLEEWYINNTAIAIAVPYRDLFSAEDGVIRMTQEAYKKAKQGEHFEIHPEWFEGLLARMASFGAFGEMFVKIQEGKNEGKIYKYVLIKEQRCQRFCNDVLEKEIEAPGNEGIWRI